MFKLIGSIFYLFSMCMCVYPSEYVFVYYTCNVCIRMQVLLSNRFNKDHDYECYFVTMCMQSVSIKQNEKKNVFIKRQENKIMWKQKSREKIVNDGRWKSRSEQRCRSKSNERKEKEVNILDMNMKIIMCSFGIVMNANKL